MILPFFPFEYYDVFQMLRILDNEDHDHLSTSKILIVNIFRNDAVELYFSYYPSGSYCFIYLFVNISNDIKYEIIFYPKCRNNKAGNNA